MRMRGSVSMRARFASSELATATRKRVFTSSAMARSRKVSHGSAPRSAAMSATVRPSSGCRAGLSADSSSKWFQSRTSERPSAMSARKVRRKAASAYSFFCTSTGWLKAAFQAGSGANMNGLRTSASAMNGRTTVWG